MDKKWYTSKTIWVNFVAIAALIAGYFGFEGFSDAEFQGEIASGILAIVNLILRIISSKKIVV